MMTSSLVVAANFQARSKDTYESLKVRIPFARAGSISLEAWVTNSQCPDFLVWRRALQAEDFDH
jgi:hypothetical protein